MLYTLREIAEKFKINQDFHGAVLYDVPMSLRTTFKVGGLAPLLIEPEDEESLLFVVKICKKEKIPFFVLGGGSNIVVSDEGFDGIVIATRRMQAITVVSDTGKTVQLSCGAGATMQQLVSFCTNNGFSGIEPFSGLPGSVGGAAFMNARCFDLSFSDAAGTIRYVDPDDCVVKELPFTASDWDYKKSPFTGTRFIITCVSVTVQSSGVVDHDSIEKKCAEYVAQRIAKGHFKYPCAGSVFKNNHAFGAPTGKLIDDVGLKGYAIGGAQIAPWHGNIIINTGGATQSDIQKLVEYVTSVVKEKTGFILEPEIIFCGKKSII